MHDYNNADTQRSFDVIPEGTLCTVQMPSVPAEPARMVG